MKRKSIDTMALELACFSIAVDSPCCDACPYPVGNVICTGKAEDCTKSIIKLFRKLAKEKKL